MIYIAIPIAIIGSMMLYHVYLNLNMQQEEHLVQLLHLDLYFVMVFY